MSVRENLRRIEASRFPRGSVRHPANVPHYVAAKEGDVIYQEAGVGVTGTMFLSEASPRLVHLTASPLSSGRKTWRPYNSSV